MMPLIGRAEELEEIERRLAERRLVTITGPGGIGKTSLAREAAGERDDVVVVDLTRVADGADVRETFAGQVGVGDFRALLDAWEPPALLVVDNCEHVLDEAAWAIEALLDSFDTVTVLATSRSPLDLPEESVLNVGPLAVGDPDSSDDTPSLDLLLSAAHHSGVDVDTIDREAAARLCRHLDGVPLALEIAGARLRTMSLGDVLAGLGTDAAGTLERRRFRGRSAHRGVADAVGWSIDLLSDPARAVFDQLGVTTGPFPPTVADAVTGGDRADVQRALDELVEASLLQIDTATGRTWFRMLYPVRAVAIQRLSERGEVEATSDRLATHLVGVSFELIQRAGSGWRGEEASYLLNLYDTLAASLRWCIDHDTDPTRAFMFLAVLWGVIHQRHAAEIRQLGELALVKWPDPSAPGRPDAAATVATCRNLLGDPEGAIELASDSLSGAGQSAWAAATLRRCLAQASRHRGDAEEACRMFREAAEHADEIGAAGLAMELWADHGAVLAEVGDADEGLRIIETTIDRAEEAGARINIAWARACLAAVLAARDPQRALDIVVDTLAMSRDIGYPAGISVSLRILAMVQIGLGRPREAAQTLLDLLDEIRGRGGFNDLLMALDLAAALLEDAGRPAWADIAHSASAQPVTTIATPIRSELFERAAPTGRMLSAREAHGLARSELRALLKVDDAAATEDSVLRIEGDVALFRFAGSDVRVKTGKGVVDLARLLERPGVEVPATELMGSAVLDLGAGELIDDQARRAYTAKIRELQAEIDEAEAFNDSARVERLRSEMDAIVDHLTAASGLGGRNRRAAGSAEKARSAVTQRIRSTIKRLRSLHEDLGDHLAVSVQTGMACMYAPDPPVTWRVETL